MVVKGNPQLLQQLLKNPLVKDILPIYDYELHVDESVEYMKATPLVNAGVASGKGIRVAVLDTGVDYTHAAMGGLGTKEAYNEAAADVADTPVWPQGKVIGGYDFVNGDPDPIDFGTNHGTHVSQSVLGSAPMMELDGTIKVADTTLLDYDAGLTEITLEVIAIDTAGNISESETVTITVNNLLDEASEQPQPAAIIPPKKSSSVGSLGWMSLLLIPTLWLRRKKK